VKVTLVVKTDKKMHLVVVPLHLQSFLLIWVIHWAFLFHSSAATSRLHEWIAIWWSCHTSCENGSKCHWQI